jgi:PAS domain S-box-containing protein
MHIELRDVVAALNADEVVPFFQPVVDLRTGSLKGFEILARWQHPEHGPTLPGNLIALVEEHGLLGELTRQVCHKAFVAARELPEHLTLAVNASPLQMHEPGFPRLIQDLAEGAGFPLPRLIVEVTETAFLHDMQQAQKVTAGLKALGCRLALDDFGTGYSSLKHLQSLKFDELKIDRSFVRGMLEERNCRKIVAAIIGLGQSLGLVTVAEGVETEEQADMLIWLGCELGQGWRYGRPQAAGTIPQMIAAEPIAALTALATPGDDWSTSNLEALPTLRLAQLQAIYDGAPVGLCFLDRRLRYISLNQRLAEMNGFPVKAHLGRSIEEMYPEWYPVIDPFLKRALAGEAISGIALHRPGANAGEPGKDLIASYVPAWDEADEVIGISVSLLDVTRNLPVHPSRGDGVETRDLGSEINPEVPWVMDSEGNNLQVSSRWVQTSPLGKDLTRNLRWLEALHCDDLEATIKVMRNALRTGEPIDVEYRVIGHDGEWRWMRSTGSPRFSPSGAITRWYGSVEDIHDRKLKEQESLRTEQKQVSGDQNALARGMMVAKSLQSAILEQVQDVREGAE